MCLLQACSSLQTEYAQRAELLLIHPGRGPSPMALQQKLTLQTNSQQRALISVLKTNYQSVEMVAISPAGQTLVQLSYDGDKLTQQAAPTIKLPGRDIIAIMQIAHWPATSLLERYTTQDGWRIDITEAQRTLFFNGAKQLTVHYDTNSILRIENHRDGYQLALETIETMN